jgi:hypothetical protein
MAISVQSAEFTLEQKVSALQAALNTGAITQAQYDTQYALLTNPAEPFSLLKFLEGMLSVLEPVNWAKDFASIFNIRKIIIYAVILGAFFYGLHWRIPVFDLNGSTLSGKSYSIDLGGNQTLNLTKAGRLQVVDTKTGKVEKNIRVSDIPQLKADIKPIAFQFKPIGVAGMGVGTSGAQAEAGVGVSFLKVYNFESDAFVTNGGAYLGESYRLEKFASGNTSVGLAGGLGWKGDMRVMAYVRWEF